MDVPLLLTYVRGSWLPGMKVSGRRAACCLESMLRWGLGFRVPCDTSEASKGFFAAKDQLECALSRLPFLSRFFVRGLCVVGPKFVVCVVHLLAWWW